MGPADSSNQYGERVLRYKKKGNQRLLVPFYRLDPCVWLGRMLVTRLSAQFVARRNPVYLGEEKRWQEASTRHVNVVCWACRKQNKNKHQLFYVFKGYILPNQFKYTWMKSKSRSRSQYLWKIAAWCRYLVATTVGHCYYSSATSCCCLVIS